MLPLEPNGYSSCRQSARTVLFGASSRKPCRTNGAPELPILHILLGFVAPVSIRRGANLTKISCGVEQLQSQTPVCDACPLPSFSYEVRNTFGELHCYVLPVQPWKAPRFSHGGALPIVGFAVARHLQDRRGVHGEAG
jgi:hypothetical protein